MLDFVVEQREACTFLTCSLEEKQLDSTVSGMLLRNNIEGLLPYSAAQVDGRRIISYNITSKIPLKQYFSRPVRRNTLLQVMLGILDGVDHAKEYLIRQSDLVFDPEYIYISVSDGMPFLLCLPVAQDNAGPDLLAFFRELLFKTVFDEHEDRSYVAELISIMNQPAGGSYRQFHDRLKKMLDGAPGKEQLAPRPQAGPAPVQSAPPQQRPQPAPQQPPRPQPVPPQPQPEPEKKKGLFGGKREKKPSAPKKERKQKAGAAPQPDLGFQVPGMETPVAQQAEVSSPAPERAPAPTAQPQNAARPVYQTAPAGGVPVVDLVSEETVVMGAGSSAVAGKPWLIRLHTGTAQPVDRLPYRLGKEPSYADFCITGNAAVSRSHADIQQDEQGYWLTDNNSKNHTYVDGKRLVPGQPCQVFHGTHFFLANEEFVFELR